MHITIEIADKNATRNDIEDVFKYFNYVDQKFSTYKKTSEISLINDGIQPRDKYSADMRNILELCELTRKQSNGYFNILKNGRLDPAGVVKGWAIRQAAQILTAKGFKNFYIDAGGDIQTSGKNHAGKPWTIGIRNPFNKEQIIKTLKLSGQAIATSGTYERGQHIFDPHNLKNKLFDIVSLTVIGPDILEADRFATPAFAMGQKGIIFLEKIPDLEAYMIDKNGIATYTSGFNKYLN